MSVYAKYEMATTSRWLAQHGWKKGGTPVQNEKLSLSITY